ncbi:MAG: Ig-like domain-containing protein [Bacteroidaceae bacterium]|nr:Ig-like domain-containing protein [Bacteroidaceae bacterium]
MKQKLLSIKALVLVLMMTVGFGHAFAQDVETLVSKSGTSDYEIPEGWESTGTVAGGQYLKFDGGTITSPVFEPHTGLSFSYSVATFGSGTNHPLTVRILNASTDEVIIEKTTTTPTSSTYISTDSPLSIGDVDVAFRIQLYGPTGKGVRLRNYSITGTPGGGSSTAVATTTTIYATGITNTDVYAGTDAGTLSATVVDENDNTVEGATITWSGNNDAVATIDASTGTVTLVGAGKVTFKATYAGVQDEYAPSSSTYEMTVTDSTPYIGGDVTFDATNDSGTSPLTKNGVTFTCSNGILNNSSEYRLYKNSTTTFSLSDDIISQGFVIKSVVFTGTSSNPASGFATQEGWETDGYNGTWEGAATSVSFTASGAQVRATEIVVTVGIPTVLVSLAVSGTPTKTEYEAGDALNPAGLVVTATYDDQSQAEITKGITWTLNPATLSAGDTSCGVTATVGEISSEEYVVNGLTVTAQKVLTSITVTGTPAEFWRNDTFNHDGMTVTANYDDESSVDVTDEAEFSAPDMTTAGEKTVTVSYKGQEDTYDIEVKTIANTAETAYTTAQAIALIDAGKDLTSEVYVQGIVSEVSSYSSKYYSITYWLDGNSFEVYSGKGIGGADFESADDIQVGAKVVVKGIIKLYTSTSTYEFDKNNELVSYVAPANMRITSAGWGTFCAPFTVAIPDGVKAYWGENMISYIKLHEVVGYIPANTGVVVTKAVEGDPFEVYLSPNEIEVDTYPSDFACNTAEEKMDVAQGDYLLQKQNNVVGWYKVNGDGFTLAKYRCYLPGNANEGREFVGFEPVDDPTGISSIVSEIKTKADGKYMVKGQIIVVKSGKAYNLNGSEIR